jgi:hypothetical protein
MAPDPRPLDDPSPFPHPSVVAAAAQAPLGGPREAVLAVAMACRLAHGLVDDPGSDRTQRQERVQAARQWLGTLALTLPVRSAVTLAFDATVEADPATVGATLLQVLAAVGPAMPPNAVNEVQRLVTRITA